MFHGDDNGWKWCFLAFRASLVPLSQADRYVMARCLGLARVVNWPQTAREWCPNGMRIVPKGMIWGDLWWSKRSRKFVNGSLKTSYEKRRESRICERRACLLQIRDFSEGVCRVFSTLGAWRSHDVAGSLRMSRRMAASPLSIGVLSSRQCRLKRFFKKNEKRK